MVALPFGQFSPSWTLEDYFREVDEYCLVRYVEFGQKTGDFPVHIRGQRQSKDIQYSNVPSIWT